MKLTQTQKSYRMSAVQGASSIGLMIVLFDTLMDDLRRAAEAVRQNNIEERCKQLNHGSLVLGTLESWVDPVKGGESALTLTSFYAYLRAQMLQAGVTSSTQILEAAIDTISCVRTAWQQIDTRPAPDSETPVDPIETLSGPMHEMEMELERVPFSQTG